ncbi:MAG: hypothetical protein ACYC7E_12095 [Armatimonadota bacterium]
MKPATTLVVIVFFLVAIAHLLRLIFQTEVVINGVTIPLWVSIIGCIVPALLAVLVWREMKK